MHTASKGGAAGRGTDRLTAIGLMVLVVTLFATLDAAAKYLSTMAALPVVQIVWLRFLGQSVLILLLVPALGIASLGALIRTRKLALQLFRSLLMLATTAFNFLALRYLRLDQTIAIIFLTPLVVALLAGPVLGEWVGGRRLAAIIVGFSGILIVVRPGLAEVHPAFLFSIASMLAYAVFMLVTRQLAGYDPPLVTLFYSMFAGTLFAAPFAIDQWVAPSSGWIWLLLASLGALGGAGHYFLILAHRLAPASIIAPFLYLQVVSMTALGFLVFGDLPDVWTLAGSGVVIASGIYLFYRERFLAGQAKGTA